VHRIGRTGRAGKQGASFTLVAPQDRRSLEAIEKLLGKPIEKATIEGVPEAALGDPRDSGGRGRRAEELKREHSRRLTEKKDRFQKRDPERPTASTEPMKRDEPKQRTEPRPEKRQEKRADKPRREQERRPPQEERRPPREERGSDVQGFGDSTPAFLKRK
jgi:superfamily II DNA/RNA helicase